jgi:hypothetical protein
LQRCEAVGVERVPTLGAEVQWENFHKAWRERLACPLEGKPRLESFSAHDCRHATSGSEFENYSRTESDFVTAEFRRISQNSGVIGYGFGIDKDAWDELVTAERRQNMGPAETFCITSCVRNILVSASVQFWGEKKVAIIYDQGRKAILGGRLEHFDWSRGLEEFPEVTSFTYAKVQDVPGLQCADMIATEYFWFAKRRRSDESAEPR